MFMTPSILSDNVFDHFFDDDFFWPTAKMASHQNSVANLRADIKDLEGAYELTMDLPGFSKDDVNVDLKQGYLVISAKREQNNDQKDDEGHYIRRERYSGSFQRSFYVGDHLDASDIKASFKEGVLTLNVPKEETKQVEEKPSQVLIEG